MNKRTEKRLLKIFSKIIYLKSLITNKIKLFKEFNKEKTKKNTKAHLSPTDYPKR